MLNFRIKKKGANIMTNTIQSIITERETIEALASRYHNTINRHRWESFENIRLPLHELILKYISECDKEDKGVYRNHKFYLTAYQKRWKDWLMQKEYKYMITIKLPHYERNGFKRTKNQDEAVKQIRKLIRDIERAYTGHYHFEKDAFDFNCVFEHGESGFWHCHLVVVSNTMNYETYYNRLEEATKKVFCKYPELFKTCIELTYVYDQEGLCMYLVKELEDVDNNNLNKRYSYVSSLYNLFHIKVKYKQSKLCELLKSVLVAAKSKHKKSLVIPNPINKIPDNQIKHPKSSFKQARTKRKRKRL